MERRFYGNGKLLLTGEYLVLDGAKALALPTKSGQEFRIAETEADGIRWKSHDADGSVWFEGAFSWDDILYCRYRPEDATWSTLLKILHEAGKLSSKSLSGKGYDVTSRLTFPRFWGLGTSSTLLHAVAEWFGVNPFILSEKTLGGSGYDIACAGSDSPIFYRLEGDAPQVEAVGFNPVFADKLHFVYLNRKQDSRAAIAKYYDKRAALADEIAVISAISTALAKTNEFGNFASLLQEHENIISNILEEPTVKHSLFHDFDGVVKSLGAWGGDFVLAASHEDPVAYFIRKGFDTIVRYRDMVK